MIKTTFAKILCTSLVACLLAGNTSLADTSAAWADASAIQLPIRLEDDFFEAVNAEWLAQEELPADKMTIGAFDTLQEDIQAQLTDDFEQMLAGTMQPETTTMKEFVKFYGMAMDIETRNTQGALPLLRYLTRIDGLESLEAYNAQLKDWLLDGLPVPFGLTVMADMANAQAQALYATAPNMFLPDVSYYQNEVGTQLLAVYEQTLASYFVLAGYTEEDAASTAKEAMAFDLLLTPYMKTAEQAADISAMYNPTAFADFSAYCTTLQLGELATSLVGVQPETVVVTDPQYFTAMNGILTKENFSIFKSWMKAVTLSAVSSYLSEDFYNASAPYRLALSGQAELEPFTKVSYSMATNLFNPVIGDYYGRTYLGEEAKKDVTAMVENMISVYVRRLSENTWLGEDTRAAAIEKLGSMTLQIGYPDTINPMFEQFTVQPEAQNFFDHMMQFSRYHMEEQFSRYSKAVDRSEWPLSANIVNAMYNPLTNAIIFPAAILQPPFYSLAHSKSENYGGIGAVIAHEITHAFDTNGAQFDKNGNLANWWTAEDHAEFQKRTEAMNQLFGGLPFAEGTVNGQLTLAENIADAGGLSCALEVTKSLPDADLKAFFTSWATIWRVKSTQQYEQLLLAVDSHSPNKLRVNVQLKNMPDFQDAFEIAEEDGMYMPQADQVSIW